MSGEGLRAVSSAALGAPKCPNSLKLSPFGELGSASDHRPDQPYPPLVFSDGLIPKGRVWQEWQDGKQKEQTLECLNLVE